MRQKFPNIRLARSISTSLHPRFWFQCNPKGALWSGAEISDRKLAEEASILEERNRMAREIHDTLAQAFTGILIQVGAATQVLTDDSEATQAHLDMIEELARTGLTERVVCNSTPSPVVRVRRFIECS